MVTSVSSLFNSFMVGYLSDGLVVVRSALELVGSVSHRFLYTVFVFYYVLLFFFYCFFYFLA